MALSAMRRRLNATVAVAVSLGTGPTISYAAPVVAIGEAGGVVTSTITVVRNGVTGALVVNLARAGTATSGSDYAPGPTSVTILAGQNSVTFTSATITDDAVVEAAETIIETAQLAAYPLAVAVKTITITDNDVAATYLPTLAAAPYTAFGAKRMVSGYSGPLYKLQRASDNALLDVAPASGSDLPDYGAISTWIGVSSATVRGVYEQATGGANPAGTLFEQTAVAFQPRFDLGHMLAGCSPFLWDGINTAAATTGYPLTYRALAVPFAHDRNNLTVFDVLDPVNSFGSNGHWGSFNGSTSVLFTYTLGDATNNVPSLFTLGNNTAQSGLTPRAQPSVIGITSTGTDTRMYMREQVVNTGTAQSSAAATQIVLGFRSTGTSDRVFHARTRRWGFVAYPALSDADALSLRSALTTMFSIPTTFDRRIVFDGDSIMQQVASLNLKTFNFYAFPALSGSPELFNMAVSGQLQNNSYTNRVARFAGLYTSAYGVGRCVFVQEAGINDLGGGTSTGTQLYNNIQAPLTTYLKGLGYKVGFQRLLPTTTEAYATGGNRSAAQIAPERANYNALLPGTADFVLDPAAADSRLQNPDDTTYFFDKLHPTSAGFAVLGPADAAAVNAAIT